MGTFAQRGLAASSLGHCGTPVPITRDVAIPTPSFYIGRGTRGTTRTDSPRARYVARLVTCLSSSSSMLSGTPGCRWRARRSRAYRVACARMEGIGTTHNERFSGLRVRFRALPFTSLLSRVLLSACADSRNATERLTRPYSEGPARYRGVPRDRQPLPGCLRVGRSLPELQDDVRLLRWPPAFAAVPQYLVHTPVELLPLSEPDKRISHTSGSSVSPSASRRSTTRVQVDADTRRGPAHPGQGLDKPGPRICPPLALAVEPGEQDAFSAA